MTTPADNLRDRIAEALARLDSEHWELPNPAPQHPFWRIHRTQADAVLAVLREPLARQVLGTPTTAPAPADLATVLREGAATVEALPVPDTGPGWALGAAWALDQIRRLADEAQPTETEEPQP
ncbi:hypothetical protein FKN01_29700 [Streptomyces sp. 130]|uniref:hypothetical protein n=1 Tax=Streptomyces sp. 130 TaxID=2591006 RepID=UPI001180D673|nr:hypothetical protein [Streptomyces sp. 130]TRV72566.1 hypothetical protein FKN01_29700 [Streptomyces sp. 130]